MKRLARVLVVILSTWILWQAIESKGELSWRQRRTFFEPNLAGITAEQWCEQIRRSFEKRGVWFCLPEGAVPGETKRERP